jgi:hypothetical protein
MSKLLKIDGKLVTKDGKLVKVDNPADCPCCGDPPPPPPLVCGAAVPKTATVNLCGFVDRLEPVGAECVEGQPGYAAAFNQTVELTLWEIGDPTLIAWKGTLDLPDGYPQHEMILYRGTETYPVEGCEYAFMNLQWIADSCVSGYWLRNRNGVPLPSYKDGWGFGTLTAPGAKALRTQQGFWRNIGVSNVTCTISFDSAREAANPLP